MAKLARKNQKVFAGNATNNGVFGSLQAGSKQLNNDVEIIQSLPAYQEGWDAATISSEKLPSLEEFQGVQYANSYQLAYIFQEGLPEWDSKTTYYEGAICKVLGTPGNFILYSSLANDNTGNPPATSTSAWKMVFNTEFAFSTQEWVENWVNENYINKQADNMSQVGADNIKMLSKPDWNESKATKITALPFTLPVDGFFVIAFVTDRARVSFYMNGVRVLTDSTGATGVAFSHTLSGSKGDVLTSNVDITALNVIFYPNKEIINVN